MKASYILALCVFLSNCKSPSNDADVKSIASIQTPQMPIDATYVNLVQAEKYGEALKYVCDKFQKIKLDCSNVHFVNKKDQGAYAITSVSNYTSLYPSAFRFRGTPSPDWLAAVIWHEVVHQRQSTYIRWIVNGAQQRVLGNYTYDAGLELEAWQSMLNPRQFNLTCNMELEINENIKYFSTILKNNGRRPQSEDEEMQSYALSTKETKALYEECMTRFIKKYGIAPADDMIPPARPQDNLDSEAGKALACKSETECSDVQ